MTEVASMMIARAEDLLDGDTHKQLAVLLVAKHLMDRLQEGIVGLTESKPSKKPQAKAKA